MAYEVILSEKASLEIDKIFQYLLIHWSEKIASEFINKLNSKIKIISKFPYIYPQSSFGKQIRRCVITKQTSCYYKFSERKVKIIFVYDTRQSPEKLII